MIGYRWKKAILNGGKFRIETNQSEDRTVPIVVRAPNFLLKERFLIG